MPRSSEQDGGPQEGNASDQHGQCRRHEGCPPGWGYHMSAIHNQQAVAGDETTLSRERVSTSTV